MTERIIDIADGGRVALHAYLHDDGEPRPAIVICPGGAFTVHAKVEGEPVARVFAARGYQTFVLTYSLGERSAFPAPLVEIASSVWTLRDRSDELRVAPSRVAVMGFSAGASLALMLASCWNEPWLFERAGAPRPESVRPDACVSSYAGASRETLIGDWVRTFPLGRIVRDGEPRLDSTKYIGEQTSPTFIWHSRRDTMVSCGASLAIASAMQRAGRPFELHIFETGEHVIGASRNAMPDVPDDERENVDEWVPLCDRWLRDTLGC